MNRQQFVKLAAGIIGGLGMAGVSRRVAGAAKPGGEGAMDESYLTKGLTGMACAEGWFDAHWGAAVLAGYYLCKENNLGQETAGGIKRQVDAMIRLREPQFAMLPEEESDEALIENVPAALFPAMEGGLRAHGHAVIFASLSMRALRDAPQMAQPNLVSRLCGLSRQIAGKAPEKPEGETVYTDTRAMIEATFESIARFKEVLGRPSVKRPNFTHMTTHTEALMNLDSMGYQDLARAGHAGHRVHIGAPVPVFDPETHPHAGSDGTLEEVMSGSYWENAENLTRWNKRWNESSNPNGYWVAFGHLFKLLYSYHRLIRRVDDKETVRLCSRILLERYFNPEVRGG